MQYLILLLFITYSLAFCTREKKEDVREKEDSAYQQECKERYNYLKNEYEVYSYKSDSEIRESLLWRLAVAEIEKRKLLNQIIILEEDLKLEKYENIKDVILPLMRGEIEDAEMRYLPAIQLNEDYMIADIRKTEPSFEIPEGIKENSVLSFHYLIWRYILKNSDHPNIIEIKTFLRDQNSLISEDMIARSVSNLFAKASGTMRRKLASRSVKEVESSLKNCGFLERFDLMIVKAIFAIPRNQKHELYDS